MSEFNLQHNQAALILESSDDGDINVNIAMPSDGAGENVLATALCKIIAEKLIFDEKFQAELMRELEEAV